MMKSKTQVIDQTQIVPLIKKLMDQANMSNAELARFLSFSRAYISKVLNSGDNDLISAKIKILKKFGVEAEYKKEVKIYIK
jgi:transcriptional regulator with XRE-family HTH domain